MLLTASIFVGKVYGEQVLILNKNKQTVRIGNKNVIETCPLPLEATGIVHFTVPVPSYNSFRYIKGTMTPG
jgi:hypothetical protein